MNTNQGSVGKLASLVTKLTTLVLWLAVFDATYTIYRWFFWDATHEQPFVVIVALAASAVVARLILGCCKKMVQSGSSEGYFERALAASLTGASLIVLEPTIRVVFGYTNFGFNFEELLIVSSGLSILLEEAKLTRQYQNLRTRRAEAQKESEVLITQIQKSREELVSTFNRIFTSAPSAAVVGGGRNPPPTPSSSSSSLAKQPAR